MSLENAVISTISDLKTFETKTKIAYQMAAKQLEVAEKQGELIVEMIKSASRTGRVPGAGSKFDTQV